MIHLAFSNDFSSAAAATRTVEEEGAALATLGEELIGERLGLPVESVPEESLGPLGAIFAMAQPSSSTLTRQSLGWEPTHLSLLADLKNLRP